VSCLKTTDLETQHNRGIDAYFYKSSIDERTQNQKGEKKISEHRDNRIAA